MTTFKRHPGAPVQEPPFRRDSVAAMDLAVHPDLAVVQAMGAEDPRRLQ